LKHKKENNSSLSLATSIKKREAPLVNKNKIDEKPFEIARHGKPKFGIEPEYISKLFDLVPNKANREKKTNFSTVFDECTFSSDFVADDPYLISKCLVFENSILTDRPQTIFF